MTRGPGQVQTPGRATEILPVMTLADAQSLAAQIVAVIEPFCLSDRCKVAGSVRRLCPECGDIEIVAVPDNRCLRELQAVVNTRWGIPEIGPFPSKYTRVRGRYPIDFFWCSKETFGLNYFIRTGSVQFAHRALCHWKESTRGGFAHEARLWPGGSGEVPIPTPTEEAVFEALGWDWVPPEKRV